MINLLPTDVRTNYIYARRNSRVMPWLFALVIALFGLAAITVYGISSTEKVASGYNQQINSSKSILKKENVDDVTAKIGNISSSLKLMVSVLGKEVLFSKLLQQISTVIPQGVNLTGLNINQEDGAIDLVANASNYQAATQLQANLTDPNNQIFATADLESVNCKTSQSSSGAVPALPCVVNIRALFGSNQQYLFINEGKK